MTTITMPAPVPAPAAEPTPAAAAAVPSSVASLHTMFTADQPDGQVAILTEQRALTLTDSPRGLGSHAPGDLLESERELINDELAAYISRYDRGPVVLERMLDRGEGILVHVEARVMPLDEHEHDDLEELLTDPDEDLALEIAHAYTEELETAWSAAQDGRSLPVCFIEDLARSTAAQSVA
jgi:hypothetical protein